MTEQFYDDPWAPEELYLPGQGQPRHGEHCRILSQGWAPQTLHVEFQDGKSMDVPQRTVRAVGQMPLLSLQDKDKD